MSSVATMPSASLPTGSERRGFLIALAFVSLLPLISLTAARTASLPGIGEFNFGLGFLAAGFHVALTSFFYFEPEFRELRRSHRLRFVWTPLVLCSGTAALLVTVPRSLEWVLIVFFSWQLYHYQRQNVGVLAFVSSSLRVRRTTRLEHVAIELAAFAGILGFLAIDGVPAHTIKGFSGTIYTLGLVAQVMAVGLALLAWALRLRTEGWSWFGPWHMLATLFFAGSFIVRDITYAFGAYAYAHGLQYVLFMYLVSLSRGRTVPYLAPAAMTMMGLVGALVLTALGNREMFDWSHNATRGIYLGAIMTHFVIDALVWRMSEPTQRSYVQRAFAFVWD